MKPYYKNLHIYIYTYTNHTNHTYIYIYVFIHTNHTDTKMNQRNQGDPQSLQDPPLIHQDADASWPLLESRVNVLKAILSCVNLPDSEKKRQQSRGWRGSGSQS